MRSTIFLKGCEVAFVVAYIWEMMK